MLILLWDVVYFDQRLGVAHSKCWSKYAILAKNDYLDQGLGCAAPKCWSKYTTYSIVTFK